jgi:DSBA-like thioredoxin domain
MSSCRCSRSPTPASSSAAASWPRPTRRRSRWGFLIGYVVRKPVGIVGASWLLTRLSRSRLPDLIRYAEDAGCDTTRFRGYLSKHAGAARIAEDVDSADLSGVSGTPTFFINGLRHYGAYDIDALTSAVRAAKARAIGQKPQPPAAPRNSA